MHPISTYLETGTSVQRAIPKLFTFSMQLIAKDDEDGSGSATAFSRAMFIGA